MLIFFKNYTPMAFDLFKNLFWSKNQNENKNLKKDINKFFTDSFNFDYLVLSKRLLKVNEDLFIKKLTEFFYKHYVSTTNTERINVNLTLELMNKFFFHQIELSFLELYFKITYISEYDFNWIDEMYENNTIEEQKKNNNDNKFKKVDIFINTLFNYKTYDIEMWNRFFIINNNWTFFIFIPERHLDLNTLREISFKIEKKYEICVLDHHVYNQEKAKIQDYLDKKITWLDNIINPYLKYYFINSLINKDVWDFNLTYFFWKRNVHINTSMRYKWKYRLLEIEWEDDLDVNYIEADIISLNGWLSWVISYTKINLWNAEYRVLIIRKDELYYLNIRPFSSWLYRKETEEETINDILDRSNFNIEPFIFNFGKFKNNIFISNNWFAKLNYKKELNHANINFPLAYSQKNIDVFLKKLIVPKTSWFFFINWPVWSWKSVSLMNFLKYYYDYSVKNSFENKNVLILENPVEMFSSYLKQIQVDDEDFDDYKEILLAIKRADTDLVSIWELRNFSLFWIINEIAMSQPVITTFHVSNIQSFLELIIDYSKKSWLVYQNVFWRINVSICQLLLDIENIEWLDNIKDYFYKKSEKKELYEEFSIKLSLYKEWDKGNELKKIIIEFINFLWKIEKYPLKISPWNTYKKVIEESISSDDIMNFLEDWNNEHSLSKIYNYTWYDNTILYKTLRLFVEWKMILTNIKFEEISLNNKIAIFNKLLIDLKKEYE